MSRIFFARNKKIDEKTYGSSYAYYHFYIRAQICAWRNERFDRAGYQKKGNATAEHSSGLLRHELQ
jgi:hypothetical protein